MTSVFLGSATVLDADVVTKSMMLSVELVFLAMPLPEFSWVPVVFWAFSNVVGLVTVDELHDESF